MMKKTGSLFVLFAFLFVALLGASLSAKAAPLPQYTAFPSPTPGPDGKIIYIVQPGDTLWRVSAITGVTVDEIRKLNNLGDNDIIREDQKLIIGFGGPPGGQGTTPEAAVTPTPSGPAPTESIGVGTLCIILYKDENGDAVRQEEEPSVSGGAISIANRDGSVSFTKKTIDGYNHQCFEDLKADDYNITVAIPEGYNATTVLNYPIKLHAGDETYLDFGAQPNSQLEAETNALPVESGKKSPLIGILGGLMMLIGIGLGVYAWLVRK